MVTVRIKFCYLLLVAVSSFFLEAKGRTWLRFNEPFVGTKTSPNGAYLAYIGLDSDALKILDIKSQQVFIVSSAVDSFVWSPHSQKLFFVKQGKVNNKVKSRVCVFDMSTKKTHLLAENKGPIGWLNFSKVDYKLMYLDHLGVLHSHTLIYPNNRVAKWQKAINSRQSWLADKGGIHWVSFDTKKVKTVYKSDLEINQVASFSTSYNGNYIAWATKDNHIYVAFSNKRIQKIGVGKEPSWHPHAERLIFSGARLTVGSKIRSFDLRLMDEHGSLYWITKTQDLSERWPIWKHNGANFIFSIKDTTDLFTTKDNYSKLHLKRL